MRSHSIIVKEFPSLTRVNLRILRKAMTNQQTVSPPSVTVLLIQAGVIVSIPFTLRINARAHTQVYTEVQTKGKQKLMPLVGTSLCSLISSHDQPTVPFFIFFTRNFLPIKTGLQEQPLTCL